MKTEYKHLIFDLISVDHEKRKVVYLCSNRSNEELGKVEWYEPWKQYCYFDACNAVYSQSCLKDIAHFISQLDVIVKAKPEDG